MELLTDRDIKELQERIIKMFLSEYKNTLITFRKVVTKKTFNSLKGIGEVSTSELIIKIFADEGLFFIEKGKRANTKLPVRKVGDKFELVPRLKEWAETIAWKYGDYLLARIIAEKARAGIPITEIVIEKIKPKLYDMILQFFSDKSELALRNAIAETFKGIK